MNGLGGVGVLQPHSTQGWESEGTKARQGGDSKPDTPLRNDRLVSLYLWTQ